MDAQEAAVWQRVQQAAREGSGPGTKRHTAELPELRQQAGALEAMCLRLMRGAAGRDRQRLQSAARTLRRQKALLDGLLRFRELSPRDRENAPPRQPRAALLRLLFRQLEAYGEQLEALGRDTGGQTGALLLDLSREAGALFRLLLPVT